MAKQAKSDAPWRRGPVAGAPGPDLGSKPQGDQGLRPQMAGPPQRGKGKGRGKVQRPR